MGRRGSYSLGAFWCHFDERKVTSEQKSSALAGGQTGAVLVRSHDELRANVVARLARGEPDKGDGGFRWIGSCWLMCFKNWIFFFYWWPL